MGARVAMLGTRGVPAQYGGFETAVEEIGARLVERGYDVTVYCRNPGQTLTRYRGMALVNLPAIHTRRAETLSHTALSVAHALRGPRPDVAFVFNAANAPYLRMLRAAGIPTAVNPDGLEHQRAKWAGTGAAYFRRAEGWATQWADIVIADAAAIADYLRDEFGVESEVIPYGANPVPLDPERRPLLPPPSSPYHLVVSRFVPENHVVEILRGYASSRAAYPLLVVGGPEEGVQYSREVVAAADADRRIILLGPVWDQRVLDSLYLGAASHVHGHSVGGTNPSLLRAMAAGAPITAHDNVFNREVTDGTARFFTTEADIAAAVEDDEASPEAARSRGVAARERANALYTWDLTADRYAAVVERLLRLRRR